MFTGLKFGTTGTFLIIFTSWITFSRELSNILWLKSLKIYKRSNILIEDSWKNLDALRKFLFFLSAAEIILTLGSKSTLSALCS